jgi:hypothetical protein
MLYYTFKKILIYNKIRVLLTVFTQVLLCGVDFQFLKKFMTLPPSTFLGYTNSDTEKTSHIYSKIKTIYFFFLNRKSKTGPNPSPWAKIDDLINLASFSATSSPQTDELKDDFKGPISGKDYTYASA